MLSTFLKSCHSVIRRTSNPLLSAIKSDSRTHTHKRLHLRTGLSMLHARLHLDVAWLWLWAFRVSRGLLFPRATLCFLRLRTDALCPWGDGCL